MITTRAPDGANKCHSALCHYIICNTIVWSIHGILLFKRCGWWDKIWNSVSIAVALPVCVVTFSSYNRAGRFYGRLTQWGWWPEWPDCLLNASASFIWFGKSGDFLLVRNFLKKIAISISTSSELIKNWFGNSKNLQKESRLFGFHRCNWQLFRQRVSPLYLSCKTDLTLRFWHLEFSINGHNLQTFF